MRRGLFYIGTARDEGSRANRRAGAVGQNDALCRHAIAFRPAGQFKRGAVTAGHLIYRQCLDVCGRGAGPLGDVLPEPLFAT